MPRVLDEIARLDPDTDYARICFLSTNHDFPWDVEQSLSLAFFKTYGIPSISALLDATGEFATRAQKRYDDTKLILAEMLDHGLDSGRGREATRRMNRMHGRHEITNDDYLYVLSVITLEPLRWNRRWGWRKYSEKELAAQLAYMRQLARRMNIRDVPPTLDQLERWSVAYEDANMRFTDANRRVADATLNLYVSWYARPFRPLVRALALALLDDRLLASFGYRRPPAPVGAAVDAALRLRALALRFAPRRRTPRLITAQPARTYPAGHRVQDLGTGGLE